MSSFKVLHILDHSLPLHSGYAFRSDNILRSQLKRGWQPVALTSPKQEENWEGESCGKETIAGVDYYRTGEVSRKVIPLMPVRLILALVSRLREVIGLEQPDVLHAHSSVLNAISVLLIGRKRRPPLVYEIRAFWEDAGVDHGTYREGSWKYNLVRHLETWVCRKADHVAVLCQGLMDDLLKRGIPSEKITIIFNGINIEDFKTCEPDESFRRAWGLHGKKVIGFIGSFYRYEGLDLLVEAFSKIVPLIPNCALLLVGGGEMESELRSRIKCLGLQEKVIMPGRISHERIPGVYGIIDILAYPRYSMRLTELVTPLKPLEAMAMGKALVASDIGGHRELIEDGRTGILFPSGNAEALTRALEMLLRDDTLRLRLEQQAMTWVRQEHTWEKTTFPYSAIYKKVLESSQTAGREVCNFKELP